MPRLARISVHPIKSLDPTSRLCARVGTATGALEHDRRYAILDHDGEYVNGKRTAAVHRIRARYDDDVATVWLREEGSDDAADRFVLDRDESSLASWFESYFGFPLRVEREPGGGFPDDTAIPGPTVVSTATLQEVASWYPGITPDGMRRRLRANLEIGGVPAFWEDHLFTDRGQVIAFDVGNVRFEGVNPCARCVVPSRDPETGEEYEGFRQTFIRRRRETLPDWTPGNRFDHDFRLMVNTRVPPESRGEQVHVGDPVRIVGERVE